MRPTIRSISVTCLWLVALGALAPTASAAPRCQQGYVWREAYPGDVVCTMPERREQARADNAEAPARREPGGGAYGAATCRQGFVWREARPGDVVCVTPRTRDEVAQDNRAASRRVAGAAQAAPRDRTCTVFEDRDFGGAHWTLQNGDVLRMVRPPDLGISDGIHRFIYEASWNDKISSFRMGPTCTLTLWEHVNYGGHHFRANRARSYVGDRNDKASDAVCECEGLPNW